MHDGRRLVSIPTTGWRYGYIVAVTQSSNHYMLAVNGDLVLYSELGHSVVSRSSAHSVIFRKAP